MAKRNDERSSSIYIDDAVVEEILLRLPSVKSAIRCSLVSKHWKSLICSPSFLKRTMDRHQFQPCALIVSCADPSGTLTHHSVDSINETFQPSGFRLEFPPRFNPDQFYVAATCNDVFLYLSPKPTQEKYYLCNAITEQLVAIPAIPFDIFSTRAVRFGLMCDGNSFRVVGIQASHIGLHAEIFSSEENRWRQKSVIPWSNYKLCLSRRREIMDTCYLNGTLFIHSRQEDSIIAYNFLNEGFHKIKMPDEPWDSRSDSIAIGVCQGSLRLLQISFPCVSWRHNALHCGYLRVWELDDCGKGGWKLKTEATWKETLKNEEGLKEICDDLLDGFMSKEDDGSRDYLRNDDDDYLTEKLLLNCVKLKLKAMALDPNDEEKVYFVSHHQNSVFYCNLRTKEINLRYKAVHDIKHAFHVPLRQTPIPLPCPLMTGYQFLTFNY